MSDGALDRRNFLKSAVVGGAAAATPAPLTETAKAEQAPTASAAEGYAFFNLAETAFVEALVDHMVPADELSPKGTDIGINVYIDRALAGGWGKGERLYMQGPWKTGTPSQGYQLPLTPAQLYRAGIEATNAHCRKTYGKSFDRLEQAKREEALTAMQKGMAEFDGFDSKQFFNALLTINMEGFFSDPIYGGNRNKASWRMLGFPGLPAVYADKVDEYRDKRYPMTEPLSIADFS